MKPTRAIVFDAFGTLIRYTTRPAPYGHLVDAAGRATRIETEVFGTYCLVPHPELSLNESGGVAKIDGKAGVGWMECAWPTSYLAHIRANGPY